MLGDVSVEALGPVSCGVVRWRVAGQLMATVVVKACFELAHDEAMRLSNPDPLRQRDEHERGHILASLVGASDMAPMLREPEAVLVGHAHAPAEAREHRARFAISGAGGVLLDKTLLLRGALGADGTRQPVGSIRLGFERALGGPGSPDNPFGMGVPRILDARSPETVPGTFGPIPAVFPRRKRLVGKLAAGWLDEPVLAIPDDFDWSYFQTAPADQRMPRLAGDEWLLLEGLSATHAELRSHLPRVRAVTRVYGAAAWAPSTVALVLDTLHVDADAARCAVVWRGSFPVVGDETLVVGCALALAGQGVTFPPELTPLEPSETDRDEAPVSLGRFRESAFSITGTASLTEEQCAALKADSVPFLVTTPRLVVRGPLPAIPGAPWELGGDDEPRAVPTEVGDTTLRITDVTPSERSQLAAVAQAASATRARANAERSAGEAEERRRAEAERFAAEQGAARGEEERRAAALAEQRAQRGRKLVRSVYGAFRPKKTR